MPRIASPESSRANRFHCADEQVEVFDSSGELLAGGNVRPRPSSVTYPRRTPDREVGDALLFPFPRTRWRGRRWPRWQYWACCSPCWSSAVLKTLPLRALARYHIGAHRQRAAFSGNIRERAEYRGAGLRCESPRHLLECRQRAYLRLRRRRGPGARMEDLIVAEPLRARAVAAVSGMLQDGPPVFAGGLPRCARTARR